jgi:beta-1,4-mannosyltransferase
MCLFKLKAARIVWTAHNVLPHRRSTVPAVDVLGRHLVIALADVVLVHGSGAASVLVARFPRTKRKLVSIPFGNWIDYYPVTHTRDTARAELNIPASAFTFLFIGLCAPYKNVDGLVDAFRGLSGDAALVIAGRFQSQSFQDEIVALAQGDSRIRIHPGHIPKDTLHTYLVACDAVIVPYREILTSGTAMLALSCGRPVVSVSIGFLNDIVTSDVGLLFDPDEPGRLRWALNETRNRHFDEERILQHARRFTYEEAAKVFISSLTNLAGVDRRIQS